MKPHEPRLGKHKVVSDWSMASQSWRPCCCFYSGCCLIQSMAQLTEKRGWRPENDPRKDFDPEALEAAQGLQPTELEEQVQLFCFRLFQHSTWFVLKKKKQTLAGPARFGKVTDLIDGCCLFWGPLVEGDCSIAANDLLVASWFDALKTWPGATCCEVEAFDLDARQGVALPLMCALMTRVPASQRSKVFSGRLWQQLTELIGAQRDSHARFQSAALAAILCQAPESASAFYEAAGFSAILRPEMLQGCQIRLAPAGLHTLDTTHPAALVAILQVLVSLLAVLPTHTLILQSTLQWLEKNLQALLDVLQWVTRLPVTLSSEPRRVGHVSSLSTLVSALAARSGGRAGRCGPDAMLVYCRSAASTLEDSSVDGLALCLSGRRPLTASDVGDGQSEGVALCYRCVSLFTELWSLLNAAIAARIKGTIGMASPDVYHAKLQQLEAMVHPALPGLTTQMVSACVTSQDDMSDSTSRLSEKMHPSESTKLRICSNVLQIWRHDGVTRQIKELAYKGPPLGFQGIHGLPTNDGVMRQFRDFPYKGPPLQFQGMHSFPTNDGVTRQTNDSGYKGPPLLGFQQMQSFQTSDGLPRQIRDFPYRGPPLGFQGMQGYQTSDGVPRQIRDFPYRGPAMGFQQMQGFQTSDGVTRQIRDFPYRGPAMGFQQMQGFQTSDGFARQIRDFPHRGPAMGFQGMQSFQTQDDVMRQFKDPAYKGPLGLQGMQNLQNLNSPSTSTFDVSTSSHLGVSQDIMAEARIRAGVLCAVFVHAASSLLSLRLTDATVREGVAKVSENSQGHQLHFDGTEKTFRHLLFILETSLYLLCLHFTLLTTAAELEGTGSRHQAPSLSAGIPRLAVVGQYLRLVIDFAAATGGSVALHKRPTDRPDAAASATNNRSPSVDCDGISNLSFAANVASTVLASLIWWLRG